METDEQTLNLNSSLGLVISAFNSEHASMTASLDTLISLASSGIGGDWRASASSDGVGEPLLTKKVLMIAVSLAMSEDSSIILFIEAILSRFVAKQYAF